jgi:hypothetical protein
MTFITTTIVGAKCGERIPAERAHKALLSKDWIPLVLQPHHRSISDDHTNFRITDDRESSSVSFAFLFFAVASLSKS